MAHYTRFEIYIPVVYKVEKQDPNTGKKRKVVHALKDELVQDFIDATKNKYKGITQANPLAPALFKGWWQSKFNRTAEIDYLTYLFGLIKIHEADEALEFFTEWKQKFESSLVQDEILVIYFPVQTIGDFL